MVFDMNAQSIFFIPGEAQIVEHAAHVGELRVHVEAGLAGDGVGSADELGSGYAYSMSSVAPGDGSAGWSPLTRYYAEYGTPPGRFLGNGAAGVDGGRGRRAGGRGR